MGPQARQKFSPNKQIIQVVRVRQKYCWEMCSRLHYYLASQPSTVRKSPIPRVSLACGKMFLAQHGTNLKEPGVSLAVKTLVSIFGLFVYGQHLEVLRTYPWFCTQEPFLESSRGLMGFCRLNPGLNPDQLHANTTHGRRVTL